MNRTSKAIILAAGRGRRLENVTDDRPKCLVEIQGVPLLHRTLDALDECGVTEAVIVVGYQQETVRESIGPSWGGVGVRYVENERFESTNTAYSLWLASAYMNEACFLIEADVLLDATALRAVLAAPGGSAWAGVPISGEPEGILLCPDADGRVRRVELVREGMQKSPAATHKCGGIQLVERDLALAFSAALAEATDEGRDRIYADLVLGGLLADFPVRLRSLDGHLWAEVDDQEDLRLAEEQAQQRLVPSTAQE